ncbi:uncharacterized protein PV07_07799 [Cladophialophora immunda]|uniref:Methyltransferase n=1 Tax=Cladophialophora immunda TaxID=569365 RepID=A0A0D2ASK7_9EURO|nr:uncharacterized protein PV07_07799 [Cladophialophora immunda]KIW28117.1 hypothetical protein PV07_07799 [Cladophialophora immunda]OQV00443.1 hypothetical protein CLAIMM_05936 [Cladophialophora immunda]
MTTSAEPQITPSIAMSQQDHLGSGDEGLPEGAVWSEIEYLAVDAKHQHEKPYELRFQAGGTIPETNMVDESRKVLICNFRPLENSRNFEEYGFSAEKIGCTLPSAEYDDKEKVGKTYYPAIKRMLWQKFPDATQIRILEHGLRKRDPEFPATDKPFFKHVQPSTIAHMGQWLDTILCRYGTHQVPDYSIYSAARTAQGAFKMGPDQYRRLVTVNVWKSLQGPGNDWPLALCDWRTLDRPSESVVVDVVYSKDFTENESVYYSPNHKWYYFKDLQDDEVIVFHQTDSALPGGGGVAHASFQNPDADKNAAPRTSIELRAFVFYL